MFVQLLPVFLTAVLVSGRPDGDGEDPRVWHALRQVLPEPYAKYAEEQGLSTRRIFQNKVVHKLHDQVVEDSKRLTARQKIIDEYVKCSCPKCPEDQKDDKKVPKQLNFAFLNPVNFVSDFLSSCEIKLVLETVAALRKNMDYIQVQNQQLYKVVSCNCPEAKKCRELLDPLIFSIVIGLNDTQLNDAYWQSTLEDFPKIMERGIFDTLQTAAANIMSYFYNTFRARPTTTEAPVHLASPAASIFADGHHEDEWLNSNPSNKQGCPHVQVNITNQSKDNDTQVNISNSTA